MKLPSEKGRPVVGTGDGKTEPNDEILHCLASAVKRARSALEFSAWLAEWRGRLLTEDFIHELEGRGGR